jgi:hypothetical protein
MLNTLKDMFYIQSYEHYIGLCPPILLHFTPYHTYNKLVKHLRLIY